MYSLLFSDFPKGVENHYLDIKKYIKDSYKVAVLPWAFPVELDAERFENEYFSKDTNRYQRYIGALKKIGIKDENIIICNCYKDDRDKLLNILEDVDVIFLPGGNPEMMYQKIVHGTELLYVLKHTKKIVIGESAGTELQLKRYFITAKNNYYKYFAFYDGLGLLDDPFYMDVHTINNKNYLNKLQKIANEKGKDVYAIYDGGVIIYNRDNLKMSILDPVKKFSPKNSERISD